MKPAVRYGLSSMAANFLLALGCIALFSWLPFGTIVNALVSALVWMIGGYVFDRWHLSRLSPEDRAEEMRRRVDSGM